MTNKTSLVVTVAAVGILNSLTAAAGQTAADLVVRDAWVREATPQDQGTGAFLIVENRSATAVSLVGVDGAGAGTGELHTMKMVEKPAGGMNMGRQAGTGTAAPTGATPPAEMMTMERVKEIPVPARGSVELKPGAFHIMLFKLSKPLVAGSSTTLTLHFSNGVTKSVPVAVVKRSATGLK